MDSALSGLQIVRVAMFMGIVFYVLIPQWLSPSPERPPERAVFYVLMIVSGSMAVTIFVVRRLMLPSAVAILQQDPNDSAALGRWRGAYFITFAMAEAIALYGLVLRFMGFALPEVAPFYLAGFVLLAFLGPKKIRTEIG